MKANPFFLVFWTMWSAAAAQPAVTVRIYNYAGVAENLLEKAKAEGRRVLQDAGIAVEWIDCPLCDGQAGAQYQASRTPTSAADVLLRIVPRSMEPEQNLGHSLGYALPFVGRPATRAYVLYDRVRERVRRVEGITDFRLLGCVMAHEIAHLLLGDEGHSRRGIMMAFWGERELAQIESGAMRFTSEEAVALRAGATARVKGD